MPATGIGACFHLREVRVVIALLAWRLAGSDKIRSGAPIWFQKERYKAMLSVVIMDLVLLSLLK
jgi:hypothetical protein